MYGLEYHTSRQRSLSRDLNQSVTLACTTYGAANSQDACSGAQLR